MGTKYNPKAKADKELSVLVVPDSIIADASSNQFEVGAKNLVRVKGTAGGFVMFQKKGSTTIPSAVTKDTMETEAGFFIVAVPEGLDYIRTSAAMRIEVIKD